MQRECGVCVCVCGGWRGACFVVPERACTECFLALAPRRQQTRATRANEPATFGTYYAAACV